MRLLAGDVGGTKTILAVYAVGSDPHTPLAEATFVSAHYPHLEAMVCAFLEQIGLTVDHACLGVAGPVVEGRVTGTNLPWVMEERRLAQAIGLASVCLLNDLEAIANAVPFLTAEDIHTLNAGQPRPHGSIAIIAPGTGLGEAFLFWDGMRYRAHPSEGGHADFAPGNPLEIELLRYLMQRFGHVSYERVCSGRGMPNIYAFLKASGHAAESAMLAQQLAGAEDPTPIIVAHALGPAEVDPLCEATLNTFVSILGAEAGNLALRVLATGGVYLAGGIPPRILTALQRPRFMQAFRHKGRLSDLLDPIPVHVVLNPKAALLGAAGYGLATWSAGSAA